MKLYRCRNAHCKDGPFGHDFEGDAPVCPKCKVDSRQPKFVGCVIERQTVHYDPPSAFHGIGQGVTLCDGRAVQILHRRNEQATGNPAVVSCKACMAHKDFPPEETHEEVINANWTQGMGQQKLADVGQPCGPCGK